MSCFRICNTVIKVSDLNALRSRLKYYWSDPRDGSRNLGWIFFSDPNCGGEICLPNCCRTAVLSLPKLAYLRLHTRLGLDWLIYNCECDRSPWKRPFANKAKGYEIRTNERKPTIKSRARTIKCSYRNLFSHGIRRRIDRIHQLVSGIKVFGIDHERKLLIRIFLARFGALEHQPRRTLGLK